MKSQLQARVDSDKIEKDSVLMLSAIKEHSLNYDSTKYQMKIILDVMKTMLNLQQNQGKDLDNYLERHKEAAKKLLVGTITEHV